MYIEQFTTSIFQPCHNFHNFHKVGGVKEARFPHWHSQTHIHKLLWKAPCNGTCNINKIIIYIICQGLPRKHQLIHHNFLYSLVTFLVQYIIYTWPEQLWVTNSFHKQLCKIQDFWPTEDICQPILISSVIYPTDTTFEEHSIKLCFLFYTLL